MGDRDILETYSNSASKNTSETDIFPNGTKSLLTSVIYNILHITLHLLVYSLITVIMHEMSNIKAEHVS